MRVLNQEQNGYLSEAPAAREFKTTRLKNDEIKT